MNTKTKIVRYFKKITRVIRSLWGALLFGFPAKKLRLIGVTGTSGKSTTSTLIYHLLNKNNFKVGLISTVGAIAGNKKIDTGLHVTTPDPIQLQKILSEMVKSGIEYVVVECSSHALDQGRLGLIKFDYAVFTNIKRDHLDYHATWENYVEAKAILIDKLKANGKAVLNKDDGQAFSYILKNKGLEQSKVISYSASQECSDIQSSLGGLVFNYRNQIFRLPIIGEYNISNALGAIKVAEDLNISLQGAANALTSFEGIEGRMQIMMKEPFSVIVDFAHNTDSLEKSLISIRKFLPEGNKLITVFGSAGLRDVEKRFTMGESSAKFADITVITAEDPRIEKLYDINSSIIQGTEKEGGILVKRFATHQEYLDYKIKESDYSSKNVFAFDEEDVNSRYDAVDFALKLAKKGDVVITEGKGHEQSLCFGTVEYPFTDQDAVRKSSRFKNSN